MVVDDAIVVLENITTHIERGSAPKQAAVHATNEVAISVIASTLTMLAVFLPLTMVTGMAGILFKQLGWIVSIIMIVSTVGVKNKVYKRPFLGFCLSSREFSIAALVSIANLCTANNTIAIITTGPIAKDIALRR